jgi:hypothetical protein
MMLTSGDAPCTARRLVTNPAGKILSLSRFSLDNTSTPGVYTHAVGLRGKKRASTTVSPDAAPESHPAPPRRSTPPGVTGRGGTKKLLEWRDYKAVKVPNWRSWVPKPGVFQMLTGDRLILWDSTLKLWLSCRIDASAPGTAPDKALRLARKNFRVYRSDQLRLTGRRSSSKKKTGPK